MNTFDIAVIEEALTDAGLEKGKLVVEATAAGNIMVQLMYLDKDLDLTKARELIKNSFGKN